VQRGEDREQAGQVVPGMQGARGARLVR